MGEPGREPGTRGNGMGLFVPAAAALRGLGEGGIKCAVRN